MAETDNRLCTASQFFMEEEEGAGEGISTNDKVVELINQATMMTKDSQRINNLKMVQELIVHKEPTLLDNFLDEMLAYQADKSQDLRKFTIGFMEDACKMAPEYFPKMLPIMNMMLQDEVVGVMKRVVLAMTQLYKVIIKWIVKSKKLTDEMKQVWQLVNQIKANLIEMLDSENDGVRTHAVKFVESVSIVLSRKTSDSVIPANNEKDISIDKIPEDHALLKLKKLEDEGKKALDSLLEFLGSPHISSINLMTCMGALTNLAKQRPQYIARVVAGYEALHVNLPPTLANSQVSSVRKSLKMQMLSLLRLPASYEYQAQITTLLTDLGATQSEVMKAMPKIDESRKRKLAEAASSSKKAKVEIPLDKDEDDGEDGMTPFVSFGSSSSSKAPPSTKEDIKQTAIDITAEDLVSRLTTQNVADLVLLSMVLLPETMPAQFQSTYTPIAAAGTPHQINHLSRLLATQLTAGGLGKGFHEVNLTKAKLAKEIEDEDEAEAEDLKEDEQPTSPKHTIQTLIGGSVSFKDEEEPQPVPPPPLTMPPPPPPAQSSRKAIKQFKLAHVTQPMDAASLDKMALEAFKRILEADKTAELSGVSAARQKVLISLVSIYGRLLKWEFQNFIFADLRHRADLALAWIYQEYAQYQGYCLNAGEDDQQSIASYDEVLTRLLTGLLNRPDQKEGLFSRLLLEVPCITPNAVAILRKYCQDETRIFFGMTTLKELIVRRPLMKLELLSVLLDFTAHEVAGVRHHAIRVAKSLHEREDLRQPIEKAALYYLKYLQRPSPPAEMFAAGKGSQEKLEAWTEDTIKLCLYLYLGLLPVNHKLIHELATVYTATAADVKRTILRVLEPAVNGMGMQSPELLLLVETCPKGAETLITRIIHILTDKTPPSPELVERVRDLYLKRVSDVRFLIPVLNGLSKKEVIIALPKLIKLNPVVVREVFNRLLGTHGQEGFTSPLTPAELLIALHNIDNTKHDMKTIIRATNLCFTEKTVYTQEVLAVVMQQLMEQTPLPTLFMRTVIQSLAMYPKLVGFVMNIMQRLIVKQVWKQKKVWEGFVRCCQRTRPQSFQILLQLPPTHLKNAFEIVPDLREPLLAHINTLTPHQRAHLPKATITVLETDPLEEKRQEEQRRKEEEEKEMLERKRLEEDNQKAYLSKLEEERLRQQQLDEKSVSKDGDDKENEETPMEMDSKEKTAEDIKEQLKKRLEAEKLERQKSETDDKSEILEVKEEKKDADS